MVLAAQGFSIPSPAKPPGRRQLLALLRRLGVVQIDSVHAVTRAHYLPFFSRLGRYDRAMLDRAGTVAPRAVFEYWGHEASLLPVQTQPLLRWRMTQDHQWSSVRIDSPAQRELRDRILAALTELGPTSVTDLERHLEHERPLERSDWGWNWSQVKHVLEALFWAGEVSSAGRDTGFRRRYALPEQVLPATILAMPTPSRQDAITGLVRIAARALGVATMADLRDYFRLPARETRAAIDALVEAGELQPVTVPTWPAAWRHRAATLPRQQAATALLVPFDPLIWHRERVQRLFGMRYRIEIYVPEPKREFGYYVFPFLQDGQLTARVDLRADRRTGSLCVLGAWRHEIPRGPSDPVPPLAAELRRLADWLGLANVVVEPRGDLAAALVRQDGSTY